MKRANRCPLYRAGGGGLVLDLMKLDKIEQVVFFVQKMKSEGWT